MNAYETEEQQVEAIRKWWQENGKMFIAGMVLTVGSVVGWRMWVDHRHNQAEAASAEYEQLLRELGAGNTEAVIKRGAYLVENFSATPYSDLAALALAKLRLEGGELAAAKGRLEWVLEHGKQDEIRDLARLRLARVHLQGGDSQQALAALAELSNPAFAAVAEEVRGDAYLAQGDKAAARAAYEKALQHSRPGSDTAVLRMKLDNLGGVDA